MFHYHLRFAIIKQSGNDVHNTRLDQSFFANTPETEDNERIKRAYIE